MRKEKKITKVIDRLKNRLSIIDARLRYNRIPFSLISNNCWGAEIYPILGMKYLTPFVGLYINAPCYIKLLKNFRVVIQEKLRFIEKSKYKNNKPKYPIATIGGEIEIHFMHYKNNQEVQDKWSRRVSRIVTSDNRLFFKLDDAGMCTDEHIIEFHRLDYRNKFSFSKKCFSEFENNFKLSPKHIGMDGLDLFRVRNQYFDLIDYLNTCQFKK